MKISIIALVIVAIAQITSAQIIIIVPDSPDVEPQLSSLDARASCDNRACDQTCRRIGNTGGVCVNGRCKCDINFLRETEQELKFNTEPQLPQENVERASCDNRACDQSCRRIGNTGGICVNGRCKCDINLVARQPEPEVVQNLPSLLLGRAKRASCDNRACDQSCRRIGNTGGVCVNGRCKCDIN